MTFDILSEKHINELAPLLVQTYNSPPWSEDWTIPSAAKRLQEKISPSNSFGLVCLNDKDMLVGMIVGIYETNFNCNQFCIQDYFVIPSYQSKGIGSALLNELECRLKDKGVNRTYLLTSRTESTEGFYKKRGYDSKDGLVVMVKSFILTND